MAVKSKRKKKVAITKIQFTAGGVLYKVGNEFKGKKSLVDALIIKNLIKWQ